MNVPYDTAAGLRDIEAYRDECHDKLRDIKEAMVECAEGILKTIDNADFCELNEASDIIEGYLEDLKFNSDELRNLEHDYDSTL